MKRRLRKDEEKKEGRMETWKIKEWDETGRFL